jgi:ketosteroid isomerase-like protein
MSEKNVELARRLLEAFGTRDLQAVLAIADPRIVFFLPTAIVAERKSTYRGHDGIRLYFDDVARVWEEVELMPGEYRDGGDFVVAVGSVRARTRTGDKVDTEVAWAWEIRDGRVVWGRVYADPADALADTGLGE